MKKILVLTLLGVCCFSMNDCDALFRKKAPPQAVMQEQFPDAVNVRLKKNGVWQKITIKNLVGTSRKKLLKGNVTEVTTEEGKKLEKDKIYSINAYGLTVGNTSALLSRMPSGVKELEIKDCGGESSTAQNLITQMSRLTSLTSLTISGCDWIDADTFVQLCKIVMDIATLRSINFQFSGELEEAAAAFQSGFNEYLQAKRSEKEQKKQEVFGTLLSYFPEGEYSVEDLMGGDDPQMLSSEDDSNVVEDEVSRKEAKKQRKKEEKEKRRIEKKSKKKDGKKDKKKDGKKGKKKHEEQVSLNSGLDDQEVDQDEE